MHVFLFRSLSLHVMFFVCLVGYVGISGCASNSLSDKASPLQSPNVVLIVADDLGYGELGSYGQEKIKTPHLDRLAAEGMRFTQFYSGSPVCAPSRAVLLTGQHTGHTYVRDNYGLGGFSDDEERGQLPLKPGTETVATMLQDEGYTTGAFGKWGLGGPGSTGLPSKQGFDFFYGYLDQKQAHNYYPTHLWQHTAQGTVWDTLRNDYFSPHQKLEGDPSDPAAYARFQGKDYAPDLMTERALSFIQKQREEPFFLYLPYTIPHVALQVPDEELAAYDFEETPYTGQDGYLPHAQPRAAYAGMISRLDRYVGQIVDQLKEQGLAENTLVLFTSDNGPTWISGVDYSFFNSNGPLRGRKASLYEGGIRVPMIAWWPGRIEAGRTTDHVAAFWDVLPTLADLTGTAPPDSIDGTSFLPALLSREERQEEHSTLYWEYYGRCSGQQALRRGKWKGIRIGIQDSLDAPLELYNLDEDPGEEHNVAAEHPEVAQDIWKRMQEAHTPSEKERWNFRMVEQAKLAAGTPRHVCLPWNERAE